MIKWKLPEYRIGIYKRYLAINYTPGRIRHRRYDIDAGPGHRP